MSGAHWNAVVEQGRKAQMLGQLAVRLRAAGQFSQVPLAVQRHLALSELTAQRRSESGLWELVAMRRSIDPAIPLVFLKGCAYTAAKDANASGRIFSDVDVLVRRQDLPRVEAALVSVGWKPSRVSDYDLAYYRDWMHEVPPMEHVRRHTVVDLHHAINPPVSRHYVHTEKLMEHMVELQPGVFVLSATDRVIHCALHLLQEGDSKKLIRDLYDLHLLVQQHHHSELKLGQLIERAQVLGVRPLVVAALGAARELFDDTFSSGKPFDWRQSFVTAAATGAIGKASMRGELAGIAMLAHSHWMKMPMKLLLPHLARKTWLKWVPEKSQKS
jgi:hypothetical protein